MAAKIFRYFIKMAYMGTGFHGWQVQSVSPSIQEEVEKALSLILNEPIRLTGAGRTDTGVHARILYAHFDSMHTPGEMEGLQPAFKSNRMLPATVALYDIFPVNKKAHARFHATYRTYHYYICTKKDPFFADRAWLQIRPLNVDAMQEAAGLLLEYKDFSSFSRSNTQAKTSICKLQMARWEIDGHILCFKIRSDRFLRNMVRAIVGTMVDVGLGKLTVGGFKQIIQSGDRRKAGYSAPACGLYLEEISYPEDIF